jgi:CheY-like chemotaxis protein
MSPEQLRDPSKVDHRSDLYSLAVVAYEALTGRLPFAAQSVEELLTKLYDENIPITLPSQILPELGPGVDEFFARALSRDPMQRFQSARELATAFATLSEAGPRTIKVLVVDDEPDVAVLVRHRLRQKIRLGTYEFLFASDGAAALEQLGRHSDIDLLLSDLNMPGMDGLTLLEHVNAQYPAVKVIVVSAYGDLRNIREAMNRGAFDFLTKPIDFTDLERTIDKAAQYVRALRRSAEWAEENALLRTFVSSSLLDRLLPRAPDAAAMPCQAAEGTVVIVNLRSSRALPGGKDAPPLSHTPDAVVRGLNSALDALAPEIVQRGGSLEKLFGNSALAVFREAEHTARALDACLALRAQLEQHSSDLPIPFRVGIAVDVGAILYASLGAPALRRMEYTVLGQPVSNALGLEPLALSGQILVTSAVVRQVADKFEFQARSSAGLPGEMDRLRLIKLIGRAGAAGRETAHANEPLAASTGALDDTLIPSSPMLPEAPVRGRGKAG